MGLISAIRKSDGVTENGMVTNSTSLDSCLDFFFKAGSLRNSDPASIIAIFSAALAADPLKAMKILFWARDIREGAGERRLFRICLAHLIKYHQQYLKANLGIIQDYGRWDDLLVVIEEAPNTDISREVSSMILNAIQKDGNALAAKWMPRKGKVANELRKAWGMTPKEYRKLLVEKTSVIETQMCSKKWGDINYSHVPSVAAARYTNAFRKNDSARYDQYLKELANPGENDIRVKVNAGAVYPYDVVKTLNRGVQELAVEQWKALPDFMEGNTKKILPVVDVSGSMSSAVSSSKNLSCMDVAISLGLYISERNTGPFENAFVTFTESPTLQYLDGNLLERHTQLRDSDWGMSTNLEGVFDLILQKAHESNLPQSDLPDQILIISDMEFNMAIDDSELTAFGMIKKKYESSGYVIPEVVFWNVQSRSRGNLPVRFDENGTALISGFSPSILKSLLSGGRITPLDIMNQSVESDRYKNISI
jgi:hypothetical protein